MNTLRNISPVWTTVEAADYLKIADSTLSKKRGKGNGPPFLKIGRRVLYVKADVDTWMLGCRTNSTCEYPRTPPPNCDEDDDPAPPE